MRADMAKVIVERPRHRGASRGGRARKFGEQPTVQGHRRWQAERGNLPRLNENLAPLRRYLMSQVGRPWNKVYSEICANLRVTNVVQQHVRQHLDDFVVVDPPRVDQYRGFFRKTAWRATLWRQPLYVDPRDGILKQTDLHPEAKVAKRRLESQERQAKDVDRIELALGRRLCRVDGIWYEARMTLPSPVYATRVERREVPPRHRREGGPTEEKVEVRRLQTPPLRDVFSGKLVPAGPDVDDPAAWHLYRQKHPERRVATEKRQLSRAELRRHGLHND